MTTATLELLAWGYGLVEGPRTDSANNLYFTDAIKGGVYRRSPDGTIENLVAGRKMVGGLALHADGGFVMSGPDVVHWRTARSGCCCDSTRSSTGTTSSPTPRAASTWARCAWT